MNAFRSLYAATLLAALAAAAALLLQMSAQAQPGAAPAPAPQPAPGLDKLPPVSGEALAHTCAACHGMQGRLGDESFMPLAGMPADQFVRTMQHFRSGLRPATLMGHVARGFSDADLQAMADYFARQTPGAGSAAALLPPPAARANPPGARP